MRNLIISQTSSKTSIAIYSWYNTNWTPFHWMLHGLPSAHIKTLLSSFLTQTLCSSNSKLYTCSSQTYQTLIPLCLHKYCLGCFYLVGLQAYVWLSFKSHLTCHFPEWSSHALSCFVFSTAPTIFWDPYLFISQLYFLSPVLDYKLLESRGSVSH